MGKKQRGEGTLGGFTESLRENKTCTMKADLLPEFGVLRVHHGRTLSQDFSYANSTDLLFNCPRHLLNLRNNYFLQHHTKHSATQKKRTCAMRVSVINVFCATRHSTMCSIGTFWLRVKNLLRLDVVKNLLECDGAIFDTIQVDKHQETCENQRV